MAIQFRVFSYLFSNDGFHLRLFQFALCHLAQIFGSIQAIDEENAVEVIDFVLEDAGEPTFGTYANVFASWVLAFDDDSCGTANVIADITRDTEAAFRSQFLTFDFDDLRIDHCNFAVFVLSNEDAL
jgi:hypothetical protein